MVKKYQHLTEQKRIFLRIMLEKRYAKNKIAKILEVDRSTIYRELKRNCFKHWRYGNDIYWSDSADKKQFNYFERTQDAIYYCY